MAVAVVNEAGERIDTFRSDAEACRWWLEAGRRGDTLDGGELMSEVCADVLELVVGFDADGCVVAER